jgi:GT2 family glycosyltransferase
MEKLMKENPSVAIIVLNWNGLDDTIACLQSLQKSGYANYRIVVVDNGSNGNQGTRIHRIFPQVHLIQNITNRGFAGGNNDGIRWAIENGFDYVVNLNNDCIVESDWLERLVSGVESRGADFASSRIMYYPETHLICSDENVLLPDGSGLVVNHLKTANPKSSIRPILSASGAASIYSIRCLKAVELLDGQFFDELYFAYLEDLDLGIRVNTLGFKGVCIPNAVVYHKESRTSGYRSFFQMFHLEKNRILIELLNYPIWLIPVGEIYYCLKTLLRMVEEYFCRQEKARWIERTPEIGNRTEIIIQSRLWILRNTSAICRDRRDRKARDLINRKIYKLFFWKPYLVSIRKGITFRY